MKRPLAYITAPWGDDGIKTRDLAARYCRAVYDAGYSPVCPVLMYPAFLKDDVPQEVRDRTDMSNELLRRSKLLVVCGKEPDDGVRADIALAKHMHIAATTLEGVMVVDGTARENE
ncbi:MAG: hypothetical protein Q4E57_05920 [Eubacteriales bacterium]|nr:hypothetical protein [Eubacteriales bacterium]